MPITGTCTKGQGAVQTSLAGPGRGMPIIGTCTQAEGAVQALPTGRSLCGQPAAGASTCCGQEQ